MGGGAGKGRTLGWTGRFRLILILMLGLGACTQFRQDPDPTPTTTISAQLPQIQLSWKDTTLEVDFDSLVPNKTVPYSARFTQPAQGRLRLQGSLLRYEPAQVNWERDSCTYTLCQGDNCGKGQIIFLNPNHTASCQQEATTHQAIAGSMGQFEQAIVPAGSNGSLTSFTSELGFTVDTLTGSHGKNLTYLAAGNGDSTNWGFDRVTYRWEDGAGCHEGAIEVVIGDTCAPHAHPFTAATAGTAFFPMDTLARRSRGCRNASADGIFYLKGRVPNLHTGYGLVSDTTILGERGLYYRRITPGFQPDGFQYYYIHNSDFSNRVTRATVTLTF